MVYLRVLRELENWLGRYWVQVKIFDAGRLDGKSSGRGEVRYAYANWDSDSLASVGSSFRGVVRIVTVAFASTLLVMGRIRQLFGAVMARVRAFRKSQTATQSFQAEIGTSGSLAARVIREKREPTTLEINVQDPVSVTDRSVLRAPGETTDGIRVAD